MVRTLVVLVAASFLASPSRVDSADLEVMLHAYVLSGAYEPPGGGRLFVNEAALTRAVRARLREFRARTTRVTSRLVPPKNGIDADGKDGFLPRQDIERAIVGLFNVPGIEREAATYAQKAVASWEYEGYPDGPLAEAAYAEGYLARRPQTPAAPYLHLYLAHRYRVAFEAHGNQKNRAGQKTAARRYRLWLARARASSDPLLRAAAEDLDCQPFIYIKPTDPTSHPRTFD